MNDLPDSWYHTHWRCPHDKATGRLDDRSLSEHEVAEHGGEGALPVVEVFTEA